MNGAFAGEINAISFTDWQELEHSKLVKKGKLVQCPECDGHGVVCDYDDEEEDCETCDGVGEVYAEDIEPWQVESLTTSRHRLEIAETVFMLSRHTKTNYFENLCKTKQIRRSGYLCRVITKS